MTEAPFTAREITILFDGVHEKLDTITTKVEYTNGKVRRLYIWLTVIGTSTVTLLFTNGSELLDFILKVI